MADLPRAAVEAAAEDFLGKFHDDWPGSYWHVKTASALAAAVRDENGEPCPACDGTGEFVEFPWEPMVCGFCEGHGKVWVLRQEAG